MNESEALTRKKRIDTKLKKNSILAIVNITNQPQSLNLTAKELGLPFLKWCDVLSDKVYIINQQKLTFVLSIRRGMD